MGSLPYSAVDRANLYAESRNLTITEQLGGGFDGVVLATQQKTAIKSLNFSALYEQEIAVYHRLAQHKVSNVYGFQVPRLISFDNKTWTFEMSIVSPPFVLDFAGARLDRKPVYDRQVEREWWKEKEEQFENNWRAVRTMRWKFELLGIYLMDVHPGNVDCRGWVEPG